MENNANQTAEYTGRDLTEALNKAARALGIKKSELTYTVTNDTTRSILGLVRTGEITIQVNLPETEEPLPPVSQVVAELLAGGGQDEEEDTELASVPQPVEPSKKPEPAVQSKPDMEMVATEVVSTLLDKMGILAAVEVVERGGEPTGVRDDVTPLSLNIVGDDLGALIGRRGETLRSLQFISRLIVSRKMGSWPNIVIDVEGYKARRVNALESLAKRMADQVRRTHQPVVLEPMPANERRIVHLVLRNDADVYTESTGEFERRKVQILPKR